ncbi:MAG: thioredoxin fold domain-containing protein [Planctomycetota bacterium]
MDAPTPKPASEPKSYARRAARWAGVIVFALAAALWIDFARQAVATDRVQWRDMAAGASAPTPGSLASASASSTAGQVAGDARPRLIYFTADWCGPCRLLKAEVFSKTEVADAIHGRFDPYIVDQTNPTLEELRLAQSYNVISVPTLLIVDARGTPLSRLERVVDAPAFLAWLDDGHERWEETASPAPPGSPDAADPPGFTTASSLTLNPPTP